MENRVTYTVRKGDSFYDIAQMFRVNVADLRTFNGLGNYKIQVGQELQIPKSQEERDKEAESETFAELAPERIHVVSTGDSLFQLAERYGVTINDIRRANQLDSNLLNIGQMLRIPSPEHTRQALEQYVVKSGDTLNKLADTFKVNMQDLQAFNHLKSNHLYPGQLLYIPSQESRPEDEIEWVSRVEVPSKEVKEAIEYERKRNFELAYVNGIDTFGEGLTGGVGQGQENQPEDVQKVETRLKQLGFDGVVELEKFQRVCRIKWWSAHKAWGQTPPSFTQNVVRPNDMSYRFLRDFTQYELRFKNHLGNEDVVSFTNFPLSEACVYPYGVAFEGKSRHLIHATYFHRLGLARIIAEALEYVIENESYFDAINTYDHGIFSFGFVQFAGQRVQGKLAEFMAYLKKHNPSLFEESFQRFGIDVEYAEPQPDDFRPARLVIIDPNANQGIVVLRGREAEEHLRSNKLLYAAFIRAGRDPEIAKIQAQAAIKYFVRPILASRIVLDVGMRQDLGSEAVRDVIRSSAGLATLIDLMIHYGKITALETVEEAIEVVADQHGLSTIWQVRNIDERKILRYLRRKHKDPLLQMRIQKIMERATEEQDHPVDEQGFSFFKRY